MRGGIGHSLSPAGTAKAAIFTGIRQQPVFATLRATKAQKSEFFYAASEKGSKLFFDEPWYGAFPFLLPCEKRFQLFGDDAAKQAFFGMSRCVLQRCDVHAPSGGIREAK
jgi:hypothetical protein